MPGTLGWTSQSMDLRWDRWSIRAKFYQAPVACTTRPLFVGWAKSPAAADDKARRPRATLPTRSIGEVEQRGQRRMTVRADNPARGDAPLPTLQVTARNRIRPAYLSNSAATALTRLREYFGSPALIEFPVLNELFPASTCAGTRLRRMGTLSSSFFFSKRSLSTASATKAVATDFLASAGSGWSTARNLPNCMI